MNDNHSGTHEVAMGICVEEITSKPNTNIEEVYIQEFTKAWQNGIAMEPDENSKKADTHEVTTEESELVVTCESKWENCEDSGDNDTSEGALEIVTEPPRKRKYNRSIITLDAKEREIVNSVENEMENILEEKATKAKLTTYNVKHILKHLVTNEHVLEMLEKADDTEVDTTKVPIFEPKLTRAKTKYVHVHFSILIFENDS